MIVLSYLTLVHFVQYHVLIKHTQHIHGMVLPSPMLRVT